MCAQQTIICSNNTDKLINNKVASHFSKHEIIYSLSLLFIQYTYIMHVTMQTTSTWKNILSLKLILKTYLRSKWSKLPKYETRLDLSHVYPILLPFCKLVMNCKQQRVSWQWLRRVYLTCVSGSLSATV